MLQRWLAVAAPPPQPTLLAHQPRRFERNYRHGCHFPSRIAQRFNDAGYLIGTYDSYHSIHDPATAGTDDSWPTAQFDQYLYETGAIVGQDGKKPAGFNQVGYKLSPVAARPYVEQRVKRNMANVPYSSYFVDADAFGEYYDDYTPGREVTQSEDAAARIDRIQWIGQTYHVPVGSEGGNYLFAPVVTVAQGIMTSVIGWGDPDMRDRSSPYFLGRYFPPEAPEILIMQVPLKEEYVYLYYDPRFRLPLYEAVFHDSVITTSHASSGSLKFSNVVDIKSLTEMLYQVPPLYHLNQAELKKHQAFIVNQYQAFSPVHQETAYLPLSQFQWLTDDRLVQQARFGDRVTIVANFRNDPYQFQGVAIPALSALIKNLATGENAIFTPGTS